MNDERGSALVLVPVRDEEAAIGEVVRGCRESGFRVLVIDDDSRDGSAREAVRHGAEVLQLAGPGHGKTAALGRALPGLAPEIDWIFLLDGDGQHRPADLVRFWQARGNADLVVGDRMADAARMPLVRRWTNRFMSRALRCSGIADSQCGFRLIRRAWLGEWLPHGRHFQFETEVALLAASRPTRVVNIPIPAIYAHERSKINPGRDTLNFIHCLLRHRLRRSAFFLSILFAATLLSLPAQPAPAAAPYSGQAKVTVLSRSSTNSIGQPIEYPKEGTPEVTMLTVEIPPGQETGWHRHPVPIYAYILEGQVTVYLGDGAKHTFHQGEAVAESVNTLHNGVNEGTVPTRLFIVVTGVKNIPFTVKAHKPIR